MESILLFLLDSRWRISTLCPPILNRLRADAEGDLPALVLQRRLGTVFFYVGTPPNYNCAADSIWYNTGNLASPTNLVDATQLGGGFYEPYAAVQASYGSYPVTDIFVVMDGGWAVPGDNQTFIFDNTAVNADLYTYELPIAANQNQCKKDGWQGVTRSNGRPSRIRVTASSM